MPVNGDEKLGSKISGHAESNGANDDLPCTATMEDWASQICELQVVDRRQFGRFRWRNWLEMEASDVKSGT